MKKRLQSFILMSILMVGLFSYMSIVSYQSNSLKAAKTLICSNTDPAKIGPDNITPLMMAAWNNSVEEISMLLKEGALPDESNSMATTPLMMASANNSLAAAGILIRNGAAVNAMNKEGITPLMCAFFSGNGEMVSFLKKAGAK